MEGLGLATPRFLGTLTSKPLVALDDIALAGTRSVTEPTFGFLVVLLDSVVAMPVVEAHRVLQPRMCVEFGCRFEMMKRAPHLHEVGIECAYRLLLRGSPR